MPRTDEAVSHLLTLFAGELVELDPSLRPASVSGTRQPSHEPAGDQPVATTIKLLDQVRQAIRARHYSYRTEKAYIHWIRRFALLSNNRHPSEMGEVEVGRFLECSSVPVP